MTTYAIPPNYGDHILVASPNVLVRQRVLDSLRSPVRSFEQATGGAEALLHLENGGWQVLFLDRRLPDLDAEELSATVRRRFPEIEVVLLDSELDPAPDSKNGIEFERHGVADSLVCQAEGELLVTASASAIAETEPLAPVRDSQPGFEDPLPGMVGNSRIMQPVYRLARLLAPRSTTVLITGPTGCGKEIVARAIHQLSPRAAGTFAVVNCAAIPETLLEAELFGYSRGAFTGAMKSYSGRIQAAQGGTLFLDEIGEMPLSLQPKLLRFLEQKELQRLGSAEVVRVDVRIVSATNAHLLSLVREGKFREDLYYRLCGFPIDIPPLRDRTGDVVQVAAHFLEKYSAPRPGPQLSGGAMQMLKNHSWPGNIRELQNVMERALILSSDGAVIRAEHLMLGDSGAWH
jgi:DNA-binding NtrC family response regulator